MSCDPTLSPLSHPSIPSAEVHHYKISRKSRRTLCIDGRENEFDVIISNIELFLGLYQVAADLDMFNRVDVRMSITGRLTRRSCRNHHSTDNIPLFVPAFSCRSFAHAAYSPMHSRTKYWQHLPRIGIREGRRQSSLWRLFFDCARNSRGLISRHAFSRLRVIPRSCAKHNLTQATTAQ